MSVVMVVDEIMKVTVRDPFSFWYLEMLTSGIKLKQLFFLMIIEFLLFKY